MVTLDTTVAGENSNSYATLTEASTYYADGNIAFSTVWLALASDDIRNTRLINAARAINRMRFNSEKYDNETPQALQFPVRDQYPYEWTEIPTEVKEAQYEMIILQHYNQDSTTSLSGASRDILDVDVFQTVKVKYDPNKGMDVDKLNQTAPGSIQTIEALLDRWLVGSGSKSLPWVR